MIYQDANIRVTAVENSHFAFHEGPAAGKHKSYAYRFETSDRVIVFTGILVPAMRSPSLRKTPICSSRKLLRVKVACKRWRMTVAGKR
jgi:hypothetical protein